MAKRDHSTPLSEEETFLIAPSNYHAFQPDSHMSVNHPRGACQDPKSYEPRLNCVDTLSVETCHDCSETDSDTESSTESQCTEFPVEALDDNGYYDSTQEETLQGRTSKTVFILHFAINSDVTNRILQLAICLRKFRVDVTLDLFERDNPPNSWPMWYEETIRASEVVLCIITEHFYDKLRRENHVIGRSVYSLMNDSNTVFRAVFLDAPKQMEDVPPSMRGSTCYCISSQHLIAEDEEFASLYAFLTGQNRTAKPEVGEMVVLSGIQKKQPCAQELLKAKYDGNMLTNNSQDSMHMFGSEGGKEADADIDIDNYRFSRISSSDSSDDELVTVNSVSYLRSGPERGLWRGTATPGFIDRMARGAVPNTLLHPNVLEQRQQSNIMEFKFTENPDARLLQGYPYNRPSDPYDEKRLSRSRHSSSSAIYPNRQATELPLPPYRDPPPYVPPVRLVNQSYDESSDFDLSECLPSGFNCVPLSFYHQGSTHSISSTLIHLSTQYSGSEQSLQHYNDSQLHGYTMSHHGSFGASYSLNCASRQSEQFTYSHCRHSSDVSLTSEIAEPADSWSGDSDCSEYLPPNTFYDRQCIQQLSLSRASGRSHLQYSTGHTITPYLDGHLSSDQYGNRRPECPTCGVVYTLNCDNQVLYVTLPWRPDVAFVPPMDPLEPCSAGSIDLDSFHCLPDNSPGETIVPSHSTTSTEVTTANHRPRKRKRKCVIL